MAARPGRRRTPSSSGWSAGSTCARRTSSDQLARVRRATRSSVASATSCRTSPTTTSSLRPDFQRGIAALAAFGLTYDILIYPRQLPAALELVRAFPRQRFVLDHLAKPDIRKAPRSLGAAELRGLAALPNVLCKLSGLVTEADWRGWTPPRTSPRTWTSSSRPSAPSAS